MKNLRPYQKDALNRIKQRLNETTHPLLVNMSVGSGKSIICSYLLSMIEQKNQRALCLTMNSTLISQNHLTHKEQGGNSGIYCSGLKEHNTSAPIIFGSPQSVALAIKYNKPLSQVPFNLIIIDECQNVDAHHPNTLYMKILNWYGFKAQEAQRWYRVIGLSGTPYRGKSISIIGSNEYFKEEVVKVQMPWLIENHYLTKPYFGITKSEHIDFSECKIDSMGRFNNNDLEKAIDKNIRLTAVIMRELISIVERSQGGAFVFCSTIRHVEEAMKSLPANAASITASTPHEERKQILEDANNGKIKYLVNVATLLVGVDCPRFHIAAFLRPTESLTLYTQAIGRALRLFPGKEKAYVLDFADNLERFSDFDDPLINEAIQPKPENEQEYVIPCYTCGTNNTVNSRRCIGRVANTRCDHFFVFKPCHVCAIENDVTSRICRSCNTELIDPNTKLRLLPNQTIVTVEKIQYHISDNLFAVYYNGQHLERYALNSRRALNIFYANFVRKYVDKPSSYYMRLSDVEALKAMVPHIKEPSTLVMEDGKIKQKLFAT